MITLYRYYIEEYNDKFMVLEGTVNATAQLDDNTFVYDSTQCGGLFYETEKVNVVTNKVLDKNHSNVMAWVFYKEKKDIEEVSRVFKKAIIEEIEKEKLSIIDKYNQKMRYYEEMDVKTFKNIS